MKDKSFEDNVKKLADLLDIKAHEIKSNLRNSETTALIKEKEKEKKVKLLPKKYNYICRKKGNTYIIVVTQNNNPVITIGPEWIFFAIFILFISGLFSFLFAFYHKYIPLYLFISGIIIYFIFVFIYTKMFISNPGFAKEMIFEKEEDKVQSLYCSICNIYVNKNFNVVHCKKCGLCVEGFNHHCGWIGKCIAKNNLYEFYFLIFWIVVIILYYTAAFVVAHYNWLDYELNLRKNERIKNNKLL